MNILFASDPHILEQDLEEINLIFSELLELKEKYKIDKLIIPGDSFDRINPTSKELDCLSAFLKKINIPIILVAANSHESSTHEDSVINHFGILKDTITVVKEYQDENKLFVGHFILKQSSKNYGGTIDLQTLKQFRWIILGHGHDFEMIKPNGVQLGSVRFISFGEDSNNPKRVAICTDYDSDKPKWEFLTLLSPYPMISLDLGKNSEIAPIKDPTEAKIVQPACSSVKIGTINDPIVQLLAKLDALAPKTKVRIIYKDYESYRQFLPLIGKYKSKFTIFKDKKEFIISTDCNKDREKETVNLSELLNSWLEKNQIPEEIKKVLRKEIK